MNREAKPSLGNLDRPWTWVTASGQSLDLQWQLAAATCVLERHWTGLHITILLWPRHYCTCLFYHWTNQCVVFKEYCVFSCGLNVRSPVSFMTVWKYQNFWKSCESRCQSLKDAVFGVLRYMCFMWSCLRNLT